MDFNLIKEMLNEFTGLTREVNVMGFMIPMEEYPNPAIAQTPHGSAHFDDTKTVTPQVVNLSMPILQIDSPVWKNTSDHKSAAFEFVLENTNGNPEEYVSVDLAFINGYVFGLNIYAIDRLNNRLARATILVSLTDDCRIKGEKTRLFAIPQIIHAVYESKVSSRYANYAIFRPIVRYFVERFIPKRNEAYFIADVPHIMQDMPAPEHVHMPYRRNIKLLSCTSGSGKKTVNNDGVPQKPELKGNKMDNSDPVAMGIEDATKKPMTGSNVPTTEDVDALFPSMFLLGNDRVPTGAELFAIPSTIPLGPQITDKYDVYEIQCGTKTLLVGASKDKGFRVERIVTHAPLEDDFAGDDFNTFPANPNVDVDGDKGMTPVMAARTAIAVGKDKILPLFNNGNGYTARALGKNATVFIENGTVGCLRVVAQCYVFLNLTNPDTQEQQTVYLMQGSIPLGTESFKVVTKGHVPEYAKFILRHLGLSKYFTGDWTVVDVRLIGDVRKVIKDSKDLAKRMETTNNGFTVVKLARNTQIFVENGSDFKPALGNRCFLLVDVVNPDTNQLETVVLIEGLYSSSPFVDNARGEEGCVFIPGSQGIHTSVRNVLESLSLDIGTMPDSDGRYIVAKK